jgi:transglutaminase-like putative cysteine protease
MTDHAAMAPRPAGRSATPLPAGLRVLPRLVAFAGLSMLGLLTWAGLVAPAPTARAVLTALAAAACGGGLIAAGRIERRAARNAALAGASVVLLAVMLLGAGVPARLLLPDRWGTLIQGIAGGVGAIPGTFVPYRGGDEWVRRTLLLGGTALTAIAVLQAFWPRERGRAPGSAAAATVSLGTLYAVPVISHTTSRPFLSGALFTVLLLAFLLADRIRAQAVAPAALLVLVATVAAAATAPVLDRPTPWVNYEKIAEDVASRGTVGYAWDHSYAPLDWPRDGRELLRIKAQAQSYWKAEVLDTFDGREWRHGGSVAALEPDGQQDQGNPEWFQTIHVSVTGLRSEQFITAGETNRVFNAPRLPVNNGGGTFVTQRGVLRRGAQYSASVYTPRPTTGQLQRTGVDYGSIARQWLRVSLPPAGGEPASTATRSRKQASFPPFGATDQATLISRPNSSIDTTRDAAAVIHASGLARIYDLAQRLKARSSTAADYVQRVRARVQRGATYTERPSVHANPLDAFLFDDPRGYCQHFSGAMALLLRMGGIPARVAVGFSPGRLDKASGEYIVRDLDAHSWVEAYFPRYGWVTFDPTPSAAPAREQVADQQAALDRPRGTGPGGDRPSDPSFGKGRAQATAGSSSAPRIVLAIAVAALLLVAALLWRRTRRRDAGRPRSEDPEIAELERALWRTGRDLPPGLTLAQLEHRLGATEAARGYLRSLSARRYGPGGPPPSAAQRSGLRRELAAGLGRLGRLRALWALPPRPRS